MKNYKVKVSFKSNYDIEDTIAIISTSIVRNVSLYSLDYHGYEHGIKLDVDKNENDRCIIIATVNDSDSIKAEDIIEDFTKELKQYDLHSFINDVEYSDDKFELDDEYTEHYYFQYYDVNDLKLN